MPIPNTGASAGRPDEASNEMVEQVVARVVAAMRAEASGQGDSAAQTEQRRDEATQPTQQESRLTGGIAGVVQQQAASRLDKQKEHAVEELTRVADTVRQMGDQLKQPEHGAVVQYASQYGDMAADQLQSISRYLGEHDMKQLVREIESFARREPLLFTGSAFLLGLMGARFLKSKPVHEEATRTSRYEAPREAAQHDVSPRDVSSPAPAPEPAVLALPMPEADAQDELGDASLASASVSDDGADAASTL